MQNKELQVRALFEKMLEDTQEYASTYEHYVKDMKNYSAKVQWKLGPISGYQVFKGPEYSFKTDAEIEDRCKRLHSLGDASPDDPRSPKVGKDTHSTKDHPEGFEVRPGDDLSNLWNESLPHVPEELEGQVEVLPLYEFQVCPGSIEV